MKINNTTSLFKTLSWLGIAWLLVVANSYAGGPQVLNPNDPANIERWPVGGANIPFNPDQGGLGALNNADAVALTEQAFRVWEEVPTATATYSNRGPLPFDVDETNFVPFAGLIFGIAAEPDGLSPIVFDEDGAIFSTLFGVNSGVLGFASIEVRDASGTPLEGVAFLNGGAGLSVDDLLGVQVHEFGHYSGLAHSVVNGQNILLGDQSGPTPNNTFGDAPLTEAETMYPFIITGAGQSSVHRDDRGIFSFLYPSFDYLASTATLRGSILAPNGVTPLNGVNVIVRNLDEPFADAASAISGDRGVAGEFTLNGLTAGGRYVVYVDQILAGGFPTTPLALPGVEEFYNGANESGDGIVDVATEFVELTAAAGTTLDNIDVVFNGPTPGVPLNLGIDGSQELFLPFEFELCGRSFDSVFVNANGNVTFGQPSSIFLESAAALLAGPPRIAALWDDLNPSAGGAVTFEPKSFSFTIRWQDVPEFPQTGANTFEIVLRRDAISLRRDNKGNAFDLRYEDGTATDGIAGFSCGGGITSELEEPADLSRLGRIAANVRQTARYEVFDANNPNDLIGGDRLLFLKTDSFKDVFEPNNSLRDNQFVLLPFDSSSNRFFTEIEPTGDDVDYFAFFARAGKTLIAEVRTGQLDSLLGLFDRQGNLLATDDDGGMGLLSRIVFTVPETDFYFIAATTFPDFDFVGAGRSGNRYVLNIRTIDGDVVLLGDDASQEIPLDFAFPYQGELHNSVFINSNGNLTFGEGDIDFSESVGDLLNGPPRIAPLWDDLSTTRAA